MTLKLIGSIQPDNGGDVDFDVSDKVMELRRGDKCRLCSAELIAGSTAVWERQRRTVRCLACSSASVPVPGATTSNDGGAIYAVQMPAAEPPTVFSGTAGASARREHDRRSTKRETRIRDAHPKLGGLILALSDDPQSTKAWSVGAQGEERLGSRLDKLVGDSIRVLHDRRIPRSKANIDHIVVAPSGVFVIDAKKYAGRPSLRIDGGLFRSRTEKLIVNGRDRTSLIDGMLKQVGTVRSALSSIGHNEIPIYGMLCFVEADWPLIGGDFTTQDVQVLWPQKAAQHIVRPGNLDADAVERLFRILASALPPA